MKRFEIEQKAVQVRFYDLHPDNYEGQFTGYLCGKRLHISGLVAKKENFYFEFGQMLPEVLAKLGCRRADLTCTGAHARLIRSALSRWVDVDVGDGVDANDRSMVEVTLTPRFDSRHMEIPT